MNTLSNYEFFQNRSYFSFFFLTSVKSLTHTRHSIHWRARRPNFQALQVYIFILVPCVFQMLQQHHILMPCSCLTVNDSFYSLPPGLFPSSYRKLGQCKSGPLSWRWKNLPFWARLHLAQKLVAASRVS